MTAKDNNSKQENSIKKVFSNEKTKRNLSVSINAFLGLAVLFYAGCCIYALFNEGYHFDYLSSAVKYFYRPTLQVPTGVAAFLIIAFSLCVVLYFAQNVISLLKPLSKRDEKVLINRERYFIHAFITAGIACFVLLYGNGAHKYFALASALIYFVLKTIQSYVTPKNFYIRACADLFLILAICVLMIIITHTTAVGLLFFFYVGIIFSGWGFMFYPFDILKHKRVAKTSILDENLISALLFFVGISLIFLFLLSNL